MHSPSHQINRTRQVIETLADGGLGFRIAVLRALRLVRIFRLMRLLPLGTPSDRCDAGISRGINLNILNLTEIYIYIYQNLPSDHFRIGILDLFKT